MLGRRYSLPFAKIMRTSAELSDCRPSINRSFASVSYKSDLAPFEGAPPGWGVPRVETLGEKLRILWDDQLPWRGWRTQLKVSTREVRRDALLTSERRSNIRAASIQNTNAHQGNGFFVGSTKHICIVFSSIWSRVSARLRVHDHSSASSLKGRQSEVTSQQTKFV